MDMFEKAARMKLRFDTPQGHMGVEDLYDLPLTSKGERVRANLDDLARSLYRRIKQNEDTVSFVTPAQKTDETDTLRFEIVKHVIAVRVAERDAATEARAKADRKQQVLEIIARKQNQALEASSIEDLHKLLDSL
jgi:hypothetical protein